MMDRMKIFKHITQQRVAGSGEVRPLPNCLRYTTATSATRETLYVIYSSKNAAEEKNNENEIS